MTTYNLTIPIKCSTLHRIKNRILTILWDGFKILLLVTLGVLNAIVCFRPSLIPRSDSSIIANYPNMWWIDMVGTICVDVVALIIISIVYDIHFKIDCIRGDKE